MMADQLPTIVLIEEDSQFIYLMRRYAGVSGCRLISTRWGSETLALIRREQPALVILDMALSGVSNNRALDTIRADQTTRSIPIILCSSSASVLDDCKGKVNGCLLKPILYDEFLAALVQTGVIAPPSAEEE